MKPDDIRNCSIRHFDCYIKKETTDTLGKNFREHYTVLSGAISMFQIACLRIWLLFKKNVQVNRLPLRDSMKEFAVAIGQLSRPQRGSIGSLKGACAANVELYVLARVTGRRWTQAICCLDASVSFP